MPEPHCPIPLSVLLRCWRGSLTNSRRAGQW
jgi:hypothetical protein